MDLLWYVKPDASFDHLTDVSIALLRSWSVEGVVLDLDNTTVPWHTADVPNAVLAWVEKVRDAGIRVCLLTNNYGAQAHTVAKKMGASVVRAALKPNPSAFRRALTVLQTTPSKAVMIGDQLFTDVLGAKLVGMRAILVRPLSAREFVTTKFMRMLERPIVARLRRAGSG